MIPRGEEIGWARGPLHLLNAGLAERLEEEGHQVTIRSVELPPEFRATEIASAFELSAALARGVAGAVKTGTFPLVLSGNCGPAALGCVGGLQSQTKIFWFDAHGDFNTPETTRSGFLDGMALAAVTGRCWSGLARAIPGFQKRRRRQRNSDWRSRSRRRGGGGPPSGRT